jgi:alkylation response protein AidB-like acyl-CoA dehydrogenase
MTFRDVKVPKENLLGRLNGGAAVFNTMMIPERLGTAAMTIGAARPALDVATATRGSGRRSARSSASSRA